MSKWKILAGRAHFSLRAKWIEGSILPANEPRSPTPKCSIGKMIVAGILLAYSAAGWLCLIIHIQNPYAVGYAVIPDWAFCSFWEPTIGWCFWVGFREMWNTDFSGCFQKDGGLGVVTHTSKYNRKFIFRDSCNYHGGFEEMRNLWLISHNWFSLMF